MSATTLVHIVAVLALVQYVAFAVLVGRARVKYRVRAPSTSGHAIFERYFRVQQNTLEMLVTFLPALWLASNYARPAWAAALGVVYLIGRLMYLEGYVRNPEARSPGFAISILPVILLLVLAAGGILQTVRA